MDYTQLPSCPKNKKKGGDKMRWRMGSFNQHTISSKIS